MVTAIILLFIVGVSIFGMPGLIITPIFIAAIIYGVLKIFKAAENGNEKAISILTSLGIMRQQ